jgi:hypothetical protein
MTFFSSDTEEKNVIFYTEEKNVIFYTEEKEKALKK